MTAKGLGMTAIADPEGRLLWVLTDGDLRRCLDRDIDVRAAQAAEVMTRNPRTIAADALAVEAVEKMQEWRVNGLFALDTEGRLAGALNMHDLLKAGVV